MKFKKGIILLASVLVFSSCARDTSSHLNDKDFDGLYDEIDPDPNDNHYQFRLINEEDKEDVTNPIDATVDYRDFLDNKYNNNLAILSSLLINDVHGKYPPSAIYNRYYKEGTISPILTQIGCEEIQWIKLSEKAYSFDVYDIADLLVGAHTFKYEDKLHQVFFFLIDPYPRRSCWVSNFDLGGASKNSEGKLELSEGFKEVEGPLHPEWINLNHHKGFDVTANRLVSAIDTHIKENKRDDAEQIIFTTGHSRGGALTNLVTKKLIDLGYNAKGYAFNPPKTTLTPQEGGEKYNHSIFNFVNKNDFVSRVPLLSWNFGYYGEVREVDVSKYNTFKELLKRDYEYNEDKTLTYLENKLEDLCRTESSTSLSTRDNEFEFYYKEWTIEFNDEEEVEDFIENIDDLTPISKNSIFAEPDGNKVTIKFRPSLLMGVIAEVTNGNFILNIDTYLTVLLDFALELVEDLIESGISLSINGFRLAHEQPIACVLATLANQQN